MITVVKSLHGFPLLSFMGMVLSLVALRIGPPELHYKMTRTPQPGREKIELKQFAQLRYCSAICQMPWAVSTKSKVSVRFSVKNKGQFLLQWLENTGKNSAT